MQFLTTLLLILFSVGCFFGFYLGLSILFGDRDKWKFIYFIALAALFLLIGEIMPEEYESPFDRDEPTHEDFEKGYRDPGGREAIREP
jgi:hypothetical protein